MESGEKVQQHVGYTDAEGLVSFEVPPESKMFVVGPRVAQRMERNPDNHSRLASPYTSPVLDATSRETLRI